MEEYLFSKGVAHLKKLNQYAINNLFIFCLMVTATINEHFYSVSVV